ncbi:MAG TPA: MBL fold metallo-hydrolase [Phycisphaerae bacterium]|nr:MBL fold metallo-hydrolase [Phycisphaerae bacterium]HNU46794.1 MBL fold metallo-hydrolase [Phycisphaerae bacterium]
MTSKKQLRTYVTNDPGYMENGYTVSLRDGGPCWIIDPGYPPQARKIIAHVREHKLLPQAILLTHGHLDHIAGVDALRRDLGDASTEGAPLPVYLARAEWDALSDPEVNLSGFLGLELRTAVRDPRDLVPEETLELDGTKWRIIDTAGHSPGGRSFYCQELGVVIVGDALFAGSVGRVDFPTSDGQQLLHNLRTHLMSLPDDTQVLSGHGPETTIGRERTTNPFILGGF